MKKIYATILAMLLFAFNINAQNYAWAFAVGSTAYSDEARRCATDASGNVYITGRFGGTMDFDPGPAVATFYSAGANGAFVAKYNSAGVYQWAFSLGTISTSTGFDLVADAAGNVYVTGTFAGSNDFDPGPASVILTATGSTDVFLAKYNSSGAYQWAFNLGTAGISSIGLGIALDQASNICLAGYFRNTIDFDPGAGVANLISNGSDDSFIAKYSSAGIYQWAFNIGGTGNDRAIHIETDLSNNIYVTGTDQGPVDFDPSPSIATVSVSGTYIAKYTSAGTYQWAFSISNLAGSDICVDTFGSVYLTGYLGGTTDFDPSAAIANVTSTGSIDNFIAKYNTSGVFQFAIHAGSAGVNSWSDAIAIDAANNVYITGYFGGTVDFDPSASISTVACVGTVNAFIAKYNSSGAYQWAVGIADADPNGNNAFGIAVDPAYNVYIAGGMWATADFDPSAAVANVTSNGNFDIYVAKYKNCIAAPAAPTAISGLTSMCAGSGVTAYSTATVSGATSYSWTLPGGWSGTSTTNTISAIPGSSGTFSVAAVNACGTSAAQTLSVTVNAVPVANANATQSITCSNTTVTANGSGVTTYTWSGPGIVSGGNSANVVVNSAGTYSLVGSSNGCSSNTATVSVFSNTTAPTITASTSNSIICVGQTATITASGASTYTWNTTANGTQITVSPTINTVYSVTGMGTNSCVNSATITQNVSACTGINKFVSNNEEITIYPNPFNDKITISNLSEDDTNVKIFNILGSLILSVNITKTNAEVNLSNNKSGIYFVKIGSVTKKIIKE